MGDAYTYGDGSQINGGIAHNSGEEKTTKFTFSISIN